MENRLAKLKIDDGTNEDQLKDKQQEIEQECVSDYQHYMFYCNKSNILLNL